MLSLDLVHEASEFLEDRIRRTPVELSPGLSKHLGVPVWLKLENLQITGSFKVRGALFMLSHLYGQGVRHVATCSAGNHGRGVAYAARELGMSATIYVPSSVDKSKYRAMIEQGAEVLVSEYFGYDETEAWALDRAERRGLPFVSAYDDPLIMAGNGGSVAIEVMEQVPDARTFVFPAGGGGHGAGFAFTIREMLGPSRFVLCEHEQSPAFRMSLERGKAVTELPGIRTLASGLEGGFGEATFEILRHLVDKVVLVSEEELLEAMRWTFDEHQYVIEGSSAVAVAACREKEFPDPDGPVVVFVSGRNVERSTLNKVFNA